MSQGLWDHWVMGGFSPKSTLSQIHVFIHKSHYSCTSGSYARWAFTTCPHIISPSFSLQKSRTDFIYQGAGSHRQGAAGVLRPQQLRNWVLCSPEHQHTDPHLSITTGFFRDTHTHRCKKASLVPKYKRKNMSPVLWRKINGSTSPRDEKVWGKWSKAFSRPL